MIAATSGPSSALHVVDMRPLPSSRAGIGLTVKPIERGGGRIGAVGGVRHQHHVARLALALRLDGGLDRHHAAELAMGAGLRRQRDGRHAGERR